MNAEPESSRPERTDIRPGSVIPARTGWAPGADLWPTLVMAIVLAIVVVFWTPREFELVTRLICAWDAFVLAMVAAMWRIIFRSTPELCRQRARADDPGILVILLISVVVGIAGLAGAVFLIGQPDPAMSALGVWVEPLVVMTAVAGGWVLLQSAYTLHYAKVYYDDDEATGGLQFTGSPPDDRDFAYFAFTVGMTFQVSDVVVTSARTRRVVLGQALLSFVYNLAIFALVINLVAGRI